MLSAGVGRAAAEPAPPRPEFEHLRRLTGPFGLYEHALFARPRQEHGYTTDDNARAVVVLKRIPGAPEDLLGMYRWFLIVAGTARGWHNRLSRHGRWIDRVGSADSQGRSLWGLGSLASESDAEVMSALGNWKLLDTHHPRANSYAVLGMAEALDRNQAWPEGEAALRHFSSRLPRPRAGPWKWPEPRLTYANARLPQALLEAGRRLDDGRMVSDGLELLDWLIQAERGEFGFSFTPVAGRGPGDPRPGFDQQPIEAWSMADACHAAARLDPAGLFDNAFDDAARWFFGRNDIGAALYDPVTGSGYDGLTPHGVNLNRGAESTLAALGTLALLAGRSADAATR